MQEDGFKREAYVALLEWKSKNKSSSSKKAMLGDGARQIGKTCLIEDFAKNEYDQVVKIDFITDLQARQNFLSIKNTEDAVEALSLVLGKKLIPGKTLIFFDEVQEVPEILTFSKYLVQDGRFDLIMSGSLLGIELKGIRSFPVGYLSILHMTPMSFEEFCWANEVPSFALKHVRQCFEEKTQVKDNIHDYFVDLFRHYLVVGGMPEAVKSSIDCDGDLGRVRETCSELVNLYREDISKYSKNRSLQIKAIFDAIPAQLAKENKRFQLKTIEDKAKFERFANDFEWLTASCVVLKVQNVSEPKLMLARTAQSGRFKLYSSDVGMLMSQYPAATSIAALQGEKSVNFGAVYENFFAQELQHAGCHLYYYRNNRKGEVDFLIETQAGDVLPVEIKSGKDYKVHRALNNLLETKEYGISAGVVLSEDNVSKTVIEGKEIDYLPIYMSGFLIDQLTEIPETLKRSFPVPKLNN